MKNQLNDSINKVLILGILLTVLMSLIFFISKIIFTFISLCCIIIFLICKFGDSKMLSFFKHFGKSKVKSAGNETRKMIARLDREGFTDAVLGEMQEQLESFGVELATARERAGKEKGEYVEVQKLYDQRLAAAKSITADVEAGDTSKEPSLMKLIDLLETTKIKVETGKSESVFWDNHLTTIQTKYDDAANDLRTARSKISQGTAKLEQANIKQKQAKLKAEEMKRTSGLSSSMSSLDAALGALDSATTEAEIKAEAATISLDTFKSSNVEDEDDVIKAAMDKASGKDKVLSLSDRLANL